MPIDHPLQAITLDLDDTLWPVLPALLKAEEVLAAWLAAHAPSTAAAFTPQHRQSLRKALLAEHPERAHDMSWLRRELMRRALQAAGDPPALADEAFAVFLAARQRVTLYPDVAPVLQRWAQRYRLVAITNGNADIGTVGIGQYFVGCISAHEIGFSKPDPRMFQAACALAEAAPQATLHIGDDWHLDVRAARAAGLQSVWLKRADLKHPSAADASSQAHAEAFECLRSLDQHLHPVA